MEKAGARTMTRAAALEALAPGQSLRLTGGRKAGFTDGPLVKFQVPSPFLFLHYLPVGEQNEIGSE